MAETLTELVAKIKTDSTELEKGLSSAEKQTEASSKKMAASLKTVGMAMAASGAAITAALGMMGKAAIDEEINMKRLATTINNSGTAYDSVKDSMEALIATTQRKTGVADDEQRNILNRLILVTNDYNKALELLPTVLDLAAAGEMDATTAATYLGKAYLELEEGAEEVSVRFGQASLQFKNMEDIQNRVAGAAENLANPLSILKASIGDVFEAIGANLLPIMKPLIDKIVDIAIKVQEWAQEHPGLAKTLTLVALAVGAVLTVVGGLILILPAIISGIAAFGVVLTVALGPIGLISLAIAGLITAGILLWQNWDAVANFFKDIWEKITSFFKENWKLILSILFPPFGVYEMIKELWDKVKAFMQRLNPWGWIKEGWGKLISGIKDILDNIFGHSIIEDWASSLSGFLSKFDLSSAGESMFNSFRKGINSELDKTISDIGGRAADLYAALGGAAVGSSQRQRLIDQITQVRYEATQAIRAENPEMSAREASLLGAVATNPNVEIKTSETGYQYLAPKSYQHGGIVENTGLAFLHEGETVIPTNESMGNVIVQFTQPVFFDREDTMNRFVDKISKTLDRKYRLSGRSLT